MGYLPVLILASASSGFRIAMVADLSWLLERIRTPDGTNIGLTVPWPWLTNFANPDIESLVCDLVVGIFFVGLLLGPLAALLFLVGRRVAAEQLPVLWGAAFTSSREHAFLQARAIPFHGHALHRIRVEIESVLLSLGHARILARTG